MKTSIKLNSCSALTVNQLKTGGALLEVASGGEVMSSMVLTADQIGVLIFALEQVNDPEFMQVAA